MFYTIVDNGLDFESMITKNELPIGIFDSGIGGLTVLRALRSALPQEHFLYLGDTARLPYGTKTPDTVRNYALNANEILVNTGIKALVVACNTATAVGLEALQEKFPHIPVVGVILPGAKASSLVKGDGPVVVLATEGTAKWHAYQRALSVLAPEKTVIEWPCSLLVALAEEGWCEGPLVEQIIARVLAPVLTAQTVPACVVLGCTHFPVLKSAIQKVVGSSVLVIDPAETVAKVVSTYLTEHHLLRLSAKAGTVRFMATDGVERFARVAQTFLGTPVSATEVALVTLPCAVSTYESSGSVSGAVNYER